MLGGQEVNVTGPCFDKKKYFLCRWGDWYDAPITVGETTILSNWNHTRIYSRIRARCIQPLLYYNGRLNLSVSIDGGETFDWRAEYTIGN